MFAPSDARLHFAGLRLGSGHSPGRASAAAGAAGGGRGREGGEERGPEDELLQARRSRCSPAPPHELIPGSAHRDDIMVPAPSPQREGARRSEQGKISIGISSCSRGNGILFKGVVGNITHGLRSISFRVKGKQSFSASKSLITALTRQWRKTARWSAQRGSPLGFLQSCLAQEQILKRPTTAITLNHINNYYQVFRSCCMLGTLLNALQISSNLIPLTNLQSRHVPPHPNIFQMRKLRPGEDGTCKVTQQHLEVTQQHLAEPAGLGSHFRALPHGATLLSGLRGSPAGCVARFTNG